MANRTFAIGDIHGEKDHLFKLLADFPTLDEEDTIVFMGDYIDRGPHSAQVIDYIRNMEDHTPAQVIALRGNHEDAWLRVVDVGWDEFILPPGNGCFQAYRSFVGGPVPEDDEMPTPEERAAMLTGGFLPEDVVEWFRCLPYYYEDDHAIYVHAGLPRAKGGGDFLHPRDVQNTGVLMWCRDEDFFRNYRGKTVIVGHTRTEYLPEDLSGYTPEDPTDLWAGPSVVGIDTGCGNDGFLTGFELPACNIYESRD